MVNHARCANEYRRYSEIILVADSRTNDGNQVCTGFKAWSSSQRKSKPVSSVTPPAVAAAAAAIASTSTTSDPVQPKECPADVERLGRHTWTFLHTSASYYPITPSPFHQTSMLSLLNSLPTLYPCSSCADELGEYMKVNPPTEAVKQRSTLERWLCQVHNEVNGRLGKEEFNCDQVGERWRDGPKDGSCD